MDSETVGIGKDDPRTTDVDDVEYAMRLTYSGEFIHAAPWSVAPRAAPTSRTAAPACHRERRLALRHDRRGDVVEYVGTDRPMTFSNGYGDWNESFPAYKAGSASP
jgi:hypothetical protein